MQSSSLTLVAHEPGSRDDASLRDVPAVPQNFRRRRLVNLSLVPRPGVRARKSNRVYIDPVLGSRIQARQTRACVHVTDGQLSTPEDTERGCENYDEVASHFHEPR